MSAVVKVTAAVLALFLVSWGMLRFYGLSQPYQAYDHPLMAKNKPWVLAWGGELEDGPSHSRVALKSASQQEDVMLAINLQMNAEKHFFAIPPGFKIGKELVKVIELSDADINSLDLGEGQHPLSLEQVLAEFPQTPLFIWVGDNTENIDLRLEPIFKKYPSRQNLMIHSEFDNVVKSIKKLIPDLIYGTGVGQRIRVLMLGSMGLETVATIDGDFLVAPLRERGVSSISVAMKTEMMRRQKIFILGPLNDISANNQALSFGATGYLTSYPRDLKKKLNSSAQTL